MSDSIFKKKKLLLLLLLKKESMKKLYRKGTIHPSPSPILSVYVDPLSLSFLPPTILALTLSLSPQDREVLAYLISSSSFSSSLIINPSTKPKPKPKPKAKDDHPSLFNCSCFRCYMSYWARWDSSPNHQLIHQIIDAFEDWLLATAAQNTKPPNNNNNKNKRNKIKNKAGELMKPADELTSSVLDESDSVVESSSTCVISGGDEVVEGDDEDDGEEEKGSVRRFFSFIGEKLLWGS